MIKQNLWRRTSESESSLRFFFIFLGLCFSCTTIAQDKISNASYFYKEEPYVPQVKDYGLELGSMAMKDGLYWLGLNLGVNSGNCLYSSDPNCQQFYEVGFGAGGRDGETQYIGSISARFQWVRFPSSWSPFTRVYVGVLNTIYPPISDHFFTYGLGAGITRRLHEHLDLRLEGRVGYGYQAYFQGIIGLQLKIDDVIASFADKVKNLSKDTLEGTGNIIKGTIEGTGKVIKGIGDKISPEGK